MVLNNKAQMFSVWFDEIYFYPEVEEKYVNIINKMKLPYLSLSDFMNAQLQTITFPAISMDAATQQRGQYEIGYASGKEVDALIDKTLKLEFKLTESYLSYWILWDQIETYLKYKRHTPCWWDPINLTFLDDAGFEIRTMQFQQIVPISLSGLNLSYKSQISTYNTIELNLRYNYIKNL